MGRIGFITQAYIQRAIDRNADLYEQGYRKYRFLVAPAKWQELMRFLLLTDAKHVVYHFGEFHACCLPYHLELLEENGSFAGTKYYEVPWLWVTP